MKTKIKKVAEKAKTEKKIEKKLTAAKPQGIKKQYVASKTLCKVTFRLPKEAAHGAENVTIVGDFNNWNVTQSPMKKLKNGDFSLTVELPCDRQYNFRYLIDAVRWENDWFADKYIPNGFGEDNSVISV